MPFVIYADTSHGTVYYDGRTPGSTTDPRLATRYATLHAAVEAHRRLRQTGRFLRRTDDAEYRLRQVRGLKQV